MSWAAPRAPVSAWLLVVSALVIVVGAIAFTNAVEVLGKKLQLGDAALGSLVAAWGTAMPEAIVPIVALLFGGPLAEREGLGIGAILGAPMLLATLGFGLLALSARVWCRLGYRQRRLRADQQQTLRDLGLFLLAYMAVFGLSLLPFRAVHVLGGVLLVVVYLGYGRGTLKQSAGHAEARRTPRLFLAGKAAPHITLTAVQVLGALALLIFGARLFVTAMEDLLPILHLPPFLLAVVLTPLATELPELLNSVLWLRDGRDELAIGNVTGAMVFQSTVLPAFGLWFSSWHLTPNEAVAWAITAASALLVLLALLQRRSVDDPWLSGFFFYALFLLTMGAGLTTL